MISVYVGGKVAGQTSERVFKELANVFAELHARTGRRIDAYGTATIEPSHAKLLLAAASSTGEALSLEAQSFLAVVAEAAKNGSTILIEGE